MAERRRGLGRGLGALIPEGPVPGAHRPVDVFFPQPTGEHGRTAAGTGSGTGSGSGSGSGTSIGTGSESEERTADPGPGPAEASGGVLEAPSGNRLGERDGAATADPRQPDDLVPVPGAHFAEVPVASIRRNERQPRQVFDPDDIEELAGSIRAVGVLQPVVVRPVDAPDEHEHRYELIMGERRWRAAQLAGLLTVPAIIRVTPDGNMLRDALLENLHRVQLNPLEEAAAYQQLLEDFACTHDELAVRLARSRPQISNTIRLLRLPPGVQLRLARGSLSVGHARALLGLGEPAAMERLAHRIVADGLSVRDTEEIVARRDVVEGRTSARRAAATQDRRLDELAARLSDQLAARVRISVGQRKGRIAIEFGSVDDLDRILGTLAPREKPAVAAATGG